MFQGWLSLNDSLLAFISSTFRVETATTPMRIMFFLILSWGVIGLALGIFVKDMFNIAPAGQIFGFVGILVGGLTGIALSKPADIF
jgi:hypothetical protein